MQDRGIPGGGGGDTAQYSICFESKAGPIPYFFSGGVNDQLDEETQRNDIEVIRQILKTPETIPVQRAFDFRFAREVDRH